jgi:hypothetical protein
MHRIVPSHILRRVSDKCILGTDQADITTGRGRHMNTCRNLDSISAYFSRESPDKSRSNRRNRLDERTARKRRVETREKARQRRSHRT